MLRDFWLMAFLAMMFACGQAEFATTTDTGSTPAAAPVPASEDSTVEPGSEAGWDEMDFPEMDDDGDGEDCAEPVKRSKDCYVTSDLRMVCKEVTLTSLRR